MASQESLENMARAQAERLRDQLDELDRAPPLAIEQSTLQQIERQASRLRDSLAGLPTDFRALLASAELGFMPGAALDEFLPRHRDRWDQDLARIVAGAQAVRSWAGSEGQDCRREFLVRGYIRGFAHLWTQHASLPADPEPGSAFFEFASRWLAHADVTERYEERIADALDSDWRQPRR